MDHHDLPDDVKAREIGNAQDRYLLFRNRVKAKQPYYRKDKIETPAPHISPPSSPDESPPESNVFPHDLPELEEVEADDIAWEEFPEPEEIESRRETAPKTPVNLERPPEPPQTERTPVMFNFPRTDYDFRAIPGRFLSFADENAMDKTV